MMKGQVYQLKPHVLPSNTISPRVKPRVEAVRMNDQFCCALNRDRTADIQGRTFDGCEDGKTWAPITKGEFESGSGTYERLVLLRREVRPYRDI